MGQVKSIQGSRLMVTINEAKSHLRITHDDDDGYITSIIQTATAMVENFTNRIWSRSSVVEVYTYSDLHDNNLKLFMKKNPLLSVEKVEIYDGDLTNEIEAEDYQTDLYVVPAYIQFNSTPTVGSDVLYPIQIEYKAGIATDETIPAPVKAAALLIIGHLYENRQDVVVGRTANEMPKNSEYLLYPYIHQMI